MNTNKTDHEIYLERELDDMRVAEERRTRQDEENRKQRQQERKAAWDREYRTARNWPDALQKQAHLCRQEVSRGLAEDKKFGLTPEPDEFFSDMAVANDAAFEIWKSITTSKEEEFAQLNKAISDFWDRVRNEVADQLIARNDKWKRTAEAIRDDQLDGYLDW
jgi:hypothetical protein